MKLPEDTKIRILKKANAIGVKQPVDWYEKRLSAIYTAVGRERHSELKLDAITYLQLTYPSFEFKPWLFKMKPMGYWKKKENRVAYVLWVAKKLNIETIDGWYQVNRSHFAQLQGAGLLQTHTIPELVEEAYPNQGFNPWLMDAIPNGIAKRRDYQRWLIKKLLKQSSIPLEKEYLYNLEKKDIHDHHKLAASLRNHKSFPDFLIDMFPELELSIFEFKRKGRGFWQNEANHRPAVELLGSKLGIVKPEDWYDIRVEDFEEEGLFRILEKYESSPAKTIISLFPELDLSEHLFESNLKLQARVFGVVRACFPTMQIKWNYKHPQMRFAASRRKMEIDIYIPSKKLGIEVQGNQHSNPVEHWGGAGGLAQRQSMDKQKRLAAEKLEIDLIEIWQHEWKGDIESLLKLLESKVKGLKICRETFLKNLNEQGLIDTEYLFIENHENVIRKESQRQQIRKITVEEISNAAKLFFNENKRWPKRDSPDKKLEMTGISWKTINSRLVRGSIAGTNANSLANFLEEKFSVSHHLIKPKLSTEIILSWADAHKLQTGQWPTHKSGIVLDEPSETWGGIRKALMKGGRGLKKGGSSIFKLLKETGRLS